jgi:glutathione S-transferase
MDSRLFVGLAAGATGLYLCLRLRRRPQLRLTYLDFKGHGEAIRLALAMGGLEFEDRRVSYSDIERMRGEGSLPYGQVPLLEIDGAPYNQYAALLHWAGEKAGLYPAAEAARLRVDGALVCLSDLNKDLASVWYGNVLGRNPQTGKLCTDTALSQKQKDAVARHLNAELLPARLGQLERAALSSDGPFLCGASLTIADLQLYVVASGLLDGSHCEGIKPAILEGCTRLREIVKLVGEHPRVAQWEREARDVARRKAALAAAADWTRNARDYAAGKLV